MYISGNWYSDDGIEVFDGKKAFSFVKGVSAARSYPYALRISKDDAIFFGNTDTENKEYDTIMIDRLRGEPFTVPLFEEWKPEARQQECDRMNDNFIGDEGKGIYAYLIPVKNKDGEIGIAKVNGTDIELLPTLHSIPGGGKYGEIEWMSYLVADLKLTDIATRLNTNSRYISDCINSQRGCSFSQFINSYRIEYAKQLLRAKPDEKISNISMKVGFANERSFFRAFKQFTGKTPFLSVLSANR